jgi:cytochrome c oxidase cbb3-type subunit 3
VTDNTDKTPSPPNPDPGTTGHEWDGVRELNNPLPKWWLYTLYVCCAWAAVICLLYPSVPGIRGYWHGLLGYSERVHAMQGWHAMQNRHADAMAQITATPIAAIPADPKLLETALQSGRITFANNCAPCHGQNGTGRVGYPALGDDVWLWGGKLADIQTTITHGVRSADADARIGDMPNFGTDGVLKPDQIEQVADFVGVWWGVTKPGTDTTAGARLFADNCATCHGDKGEGIRAAGAPPLNAQVHLYGGTHEAIVAQVTHSRNGVMPNWNNRLDAGTIKSVALYVHSLGGGE